MTTEPGWIPPEVDTKRANMARVYDYLLGGTHNFLADQDVARTLIAIEPTSRLGVRANRDFLARAVRHLAAAGIRQFLDIGSGIPTEGNIHEIAQRAAPGSAVVYADIDPVAVAHSRMILQGNPFAEVINADIQAPERIIAHETTRRLIDPTQPTGLILALVLHFISDSDDPAGLVARLMERLAPGSHVVISHAADDDKPQIAGAITTAYNRSVTTSVYARSGNDVRKLFGDFELLDPGVVPLPYWRPDPPGPPDNADKLRLAIGGVAIKS